MDKCPWNRTCVGIFHKKTEWIFNNSSKGTCKMLKSYV